MEDLFDASDLLKMGDELREKGNHLEMAERLKTNGLFKEILDRESHEPYLHRYSMFCFRPFARVCLHHFLRSDIDGLHDHPWPLQNYILTGGYWEVTEEGRFWRGPGYHAIRPANFFHRIELDPEKAGGETWTLFLMGPKEKEWGFKDEQGRWVQWEEYLARKREAANNS